MKQPHAPLVSIAVSLLTGFATAQTTWHVDASGAPPGDGSPGSPYVSIQSAIASAATVSGDTIEVAPGTYLENLDFLGKAIRVRSTHGRQQTIVDAQNQGSVVRFVGGEGAGSVLEGLTLRHGVGENFPEDPTFVLRGGGVLCLGSSPTIRDCTLNSNGRVNIELPSTDSGGGLYIRDGSPLIVGCEINGNVAGQYGGGVDIRGDSSPTIEDTTIAANVLGYYQYGFLWGGGVNFSPSVTGAKATIRNCEIANNVATRGGGIHGAVDVYDSLIQGNHSVDGGGAYWARLEGCTLRGNLAGWDLVYHYCGSGGAAHSSFLRDCVVEDNTACYGGGLAECVAENSLIAENVADNLSGSQGDIRGGGAIASHLTGCRVVGNSIADTDLPVSYSGGGLAGGSARRCELFGNLADSGGAALDAALTHCTVVGNDAREQTGGVLGGTVTNSIVWGNHGGNASGATTTYSLIGAGASGIGDVDLDPELWGPASGDLRLLAISPAIDAGNPASPLDPDGSRADMGAHPFDAAYVGAPGAYCDAKLSAQGCLPAIGSLGTAALSGPDDFVLTADLVRAETIGIFIWGTGHQDAPFFGGSLCVASPLTRHTVANLGVPGLCSGHFAWNVEHAYMQSHGLQAYGKMYVQCWYRDPLHPDGTGVGITDALEVTILP